ncbi:MAG: response regulator [Candidatus Omnitrophica bacterium]|nr:response regulator [Candidatus Omnitrophota bacterium]
MNHSKIMIVEDEVDLAEDLEELLKNLGYTVVAVLTSGEEAILAAYQTLPDLVLMDIRLRGEIDGIESAQVIYQQLHIPVVYLTAHSDEGTLNRARVSSPFGYVLKPFQEKELTTMIEIALQRHSSEESLKHSTASLGEIVEKITEGIVIVNQRHKIRYMNQTARTFLDHQPETLIQDFIQNGLGLEETRDLAIWNKRGEQGIGEWRVETIEWEGENVFLLLLHDVTRQRLLEKELRQAQKMEALGRLAGGIAHDFSNNLMVIGGYSEMLLKRTDGNTQWHTRVQEIRKASERASKLIRQLLAFSRRQPAIRKVFQPNKLVKNLEKMLQCLISENIELIIQTDEKVGNIRFDPSQMEQILMNLVINARDAMPSGGRLFLETKSVTFSQKVEDISAGEYVLLSVKDAGTGMNEEVKAHLFEPFFTTKGEEKGTGLGLAIAYEIIKQNHGYIKVISQPDQGTIFQIYLPVCKEPEDLTASELPQPLPCGTETIFLVENQNSLRDLAASMLRQQGYAVIEAKNGKEGLEKAKGLGEKKIHLLITNRIMPELSGTEFAREIGKLFPAIKVLFVTGYEDEASCDRGDKVSGCLDEFILQKPFTQAAMAFKVREVLDHP